MYIYGICIHVCVCAQHGAPKKQSTIFHFGYPCLCFVGKVKGLHRTCVLSHAEPLRRCTPGK